jgi:hypothetical protein
VPLRRISLFCTALLTLSASLLDAQPRAGTPEHEVKAAFLYQFGLYVEWPPENDRSGRPFAICVLGEDPFGAALDAVVEGRSIAGRAVAVRRVVGASEFGDCRVLFVSRSVDDRLPEIVRALEGHTVLTVGEGAQFIRRGGMLGFTSENRKVRFVVNLTAAEAAKVKLSSQLLRIAASVEE